MYTDTVVQRTYADQSTVHEKKITTWHVSLAVTKSKYPDAISSMRQCNKSCFWL